MSGHDPERRHGHTANGNVSSGHTANGNVSSGHTAHLAVEVTSGVITAVDVTAPAEADGAQVGSLLAPTAQTTPRPVEHTLGDTASRTRHALGQAAEAEVERGTSMPAPPAGRYGP